MRNYVNQVDFSLAMILTQLPTKWDYKYKLGLQYAQLIYVFTYIYIFIVYSIGIKSGASGI